MVLGFYAPWHIPPVNNQQRERNSTSADMMIENSPAFDPHDINPSTTDNFPEGAPIKNSDSAITSTIAINPSTQEYVISWDDTTPLVSQCRAKSLDYENNQTAFYIVLKDNTAVRIIGSITVTALQNLAQSVSSTCGILPIYQITH